ncbi:nad-binding oxidoreductase with nad-binding rossmann-fold domain [Diplodia corticola]|uniref:Nad-binding oxidoreductase with nad-binding rossmann-fold domain n=1 Tax=Diplodia corticola TaxID=236234 RepID=A0A1J9R490_9PEZI|nr:nad-binding oxidoreductase with nad-binding rossmann-fold domain [Diplodia corticola]OJD35042.1 nad-binding oxidoreductase with nad-binding rossmann-fold domain [Diplodia corticola]
MCFNRTPTQEETSWLTSPRPPPPQGLVTNGARVIITALPTDPIDAAVHELNDLGSPSGGTAEGFPTDLSTKPAIASLAAHLTTTLRLPHLDMLISNAGIRRDAPTPCTNDGGVAAADLADLQASMWSHRAGDWADSFAVNTTAHYFLSVALVHLLAAAAERMVAIDEPAGGGGTGSGTGLGTTAVKGRELGCGSVVVTSSCASMHNCTNVDLTSYATSKAATDHLVALLAAKFARFYVRVNAINPGFVPSNMNPVGAEGNMFANLFDKVPARRAGRLEDIAGTVLYLCSQAGAYVDGRCLCVDGGRVLVANGQE